MPHFYCEGCGHQWRTPDSSSTNRGYYAGLAGRNEVPAEDLRRKHADRLADIAPLLSGNRRVIEIGCAEGSLGAKVKALADVQYTGVEPSRDVEAASQVLDRVIHGTSDAVAAGPYDLLLAFHVLEHIPDVATEVARWRSLLNHRGTALVEVPDASGHRLLAWDANTEHFHYFSAASLTALFQRSGFQAVWLSSGHFESPVYPDSLRLCSRPSRSAACRRKALLEQFRAVFPGRFAVFATGGDFHNYVEPLLDALPVAALLDSNPARQGERVGALLIEGFDPVRHVGLPILVASVRFKAEIREQLMTAYGVPATSIFGLDDIYGRVS
jgi:SAM-dependent methyltransferase